MGGDTRRHAENTNLDLPAILKTHGTINDASPITKPAEHAPGLNICS